MQVTSAQAAALSSVSPDQLEALAEQVCCRLEGSSAAGAASDAQLALLAVLLAAARAADGAGPQLRAALLAADLPPLLVEPLLAEVAGRLDRTRRALLAGQRPAASLAGLEWRLSAEVGTRALPVCLRPELLLRLTEEDADGQQRRTTLEVAPEDLRRITTQLEQALGSRPRRLLHS